MQLLFPSSLKFEYEKFDNMDMDERYATSNKLDYNMLPYAINYFLL